MWVGPARGHNWPHAVNDLWKLPDEGMAEVCACHTAFWRQQKYAVFFSFSFSGTLHSCSYFQLHWRIYQSCSPLFSLLNMNWIKADPCRRLHYHAHTLYCLMAYSSLKWQKFTDLPHLGLSAKRESWVYLWTLLSMERCIWRSIKFGLNKIINECKNINQCFKIKIFNFTHLSLHLPPFFRPSNHGGCYKLKIAQMLLQLNEGMG